MGRTTLMLDEEAVVAARELARREHLSLGEAVSRLVLRGARIDAEERLPGVSEFAQLGRRPGRVVTSDDVHAVLEDEGE
jgi:hypothetical protein